MTVSTGGAITGFTFVPGPAATVTSPASVPLHLLALEQAARTTGAGQPLNTRAVGGDSGASATADALLRSAIVNVAKYYLGLAQTRTPSQMEALIWDNTSRDGADHGPSCAAFASLALELAAQAVGQNSWASGGTSYPYPLPSWADVRVDENPASPGVTSIVQDAETHGRWHPLGDGYSPQPGDWVLFDQHVEIVTSYAGGVLDTIGANSEPHLTVNAHSLAGSLPADGVQGFVDNGHLEPSGTTVAAPASQPPPAAVTTPGTHSGASVSGASAGGQPVSAKQPRSSATPAGAPRGGLAHIPGVVAPSGLGVGAGPVPALAAASAAPAATPKAGPRADGTPANAAAAKPSASPYRKYNSAAAATPAPSVQQAFINLVAPGAMAGQQRYGVPAAVTIAQAIDESGWGQSGLAAQYNNLFGIKGSGPAGSVTLPTSEYEGGRWVTIRAPFRVYNNVAESITDHDELLATSGYYTHAMADRASPDTFANDLSGVYATDPSYGANLIALMKLYNLYRFDVPAAAATAQPSATQPSATASAEPGQPGASHANVNPTAAGVAAIPGLSTPAFQFPTTTPPHNAPSRPTAASSTAANAAAVASIPGLGAAAPGFPPATSAAARTPKPTASSAPSGSGPAASIPGVVAPASGPGWAGGLGIPVTSGAAGAVPTAGASVGAGAAATGGHAAVRAGSPSAPGTSVPAGSPTPGAASIPGLAAPGSANPVTSSARSAPAGVRRAASTSVVTTAWYEPELPKAVTTAYFANAKGSLGHAQALYREVAGLAGIPWQVLGACDWMQCKAHPRYSPVQGEKLGAVNPDGTSFRNRSQALAQCAVDLVTAAAAIYGLDLTSPRPLSVRSLAEAFAAFRWGSLLRRHGVSAMEFPYSVAGLTAQHTKMHWPDIDAPDAPDRPGARFREPFGAVPVVLSLGYPATI